MDPTDRRLRGGDGALVCDLRTPRAYRPDGKRVATTDRRGSASDAGAPGIERRRGGRRPPAERAAATGAFVGDDGASA